MAQEGRWVLICEPFTPEMTKKHPEMNAYVGYHWPVIGEDDKYHACSCTKDHAHVFTDRERLMRVKKGLGFKTRILRRTSPSVKAISQAFRKYADELLAGLVVEENSMASIGGMNRVRRICIEQIINQVKHRADHPETMT